MVLRVLGFEEETTYRNINNCPAAITVPYHLMMEKIDFKWNRENITSSSGSTMVHTVKPGLAKPEGETEGNIGLESIGFYLKAALGNYNYIAPETANDFSVHEFLGGKRSKLPSYSFVSTKDYYELMTVGAVLDEFKMEGNDDFFTHSEKWWYSYQKRRKIDEDAYNENILEEEPVMPYEAEIKFGGEVPSGVVTDFSFELKNNLNTEKTNGLGAYTPIRKPGVQNREITLKCNTVLEDETYDLITKAEYGDLVQSGNWHIPTKCKVFSQPVEFTLRHCEKQDEYLKVVFPDVVFTCSDPASGSDEIEVEMEMMPTGRKTIKNRANETKKTDMYAVLSNNQTELAAGD